jgi:hypothetical protein
MAAACKRLNLPLLGLSNAGTESKLMYSFDASLPACVLGAVLRISCGTMVAFVAAGETKEHFGEASFKHVEMRWFCLLWCAGSVC